MNGSGPGPHVADLAGQAKAATPKKAIAPVAVAPRIFTGPDVTAIGDSVLLGSMGPFKADLPGAKVYAKVGWQARDVLKQLQELTAAHALGPVVLIHLGTNGYVYEDQLRAILALLADRQRVILVNARAPRRWTDPNNDLLDRILRDYPNTVLVDWRGASKDKPGYFIFDHVHLTPSGQRAFLSEIMRSGGLATYPPQPLQASSPPARTPPL